jgi:hypothetical protein
VSKQASSGEPKPLPSSAEKALREAHEACSCRDARGYPTPDKGICVCCIGDEQGGECGWPGHAAINRAVREAFEAGQRHRQDTMNLIDSGLMAAFDEKPLPSWLPAEETKE